MPYYNGRWHLYSEAERRAYGEEKRRQQSEAWHATWISKAGLKERLWTDKAITEFIGKPVNAGPIMAWRLKDVINAEKNPAFKIWMKERSSTLIARGKLSAEVFETKLTQAQREVLQRVSAREKLFKNKPGQYRWLRGNKSCTRIGRTLEDAGLIRCIYMTAFISDVVITAEGLSVLAVS